MAAESFAAAVALPVAIGLLSSFAIELLLQPRPQSPWRRPWSTLGIHAGLWLLAFAGLLAVLSHPWFAMFIASGFLLVLVLVNQAKVQALREPFLFQDFEYFTDALRHPRLYLPFLGAGRAVAGGIAIAAVLYAGFALESSLQSTLSTRAFVLGIGALFAAGAGLLAIGARAAPAPAFDPVADLQRFGLLTALWSYGRAERRPAALVSPLPTAPDAPRMQRPHLVIVQSESFFDPRRWYEGVADSVFADFDALRAQAHAHGRLQVPVWGANTVRSEFAFLSGIDPATLGVHRFNPYRTVPRQQPATIARYLQQLGYRTVCVHPYPASFYRRDTAYPQLGFDEFIDLDDFAGAERIGAYVSDAAVARKIDQLLQAATSPLFVFAITMENHGPLHLESVEPGDAARYHRSPPPAGCSDLTIYLRHLANASRMAGALRDTLRALPDEAWLAWYGDHVPIMPTVYAHFGEPDGDSDYLLWCNRKTAVNGATGADLAIDRFAASILRSMGLAH